MPNIKTQSSLNGTVLVMAQPSHAMLDAGAKAIAAYSGRQPDRISLSGMLTAAWTAMVEKSQAEADEQLLRSIMESQPRPLMFLAPDDELEVRPRADLPEPPCLYPHTLPAYDGGPQLTLGYDAIVENLTWLETWGDYSRYALDGEESIWVNDQTETVADPDEEDRLDAEEDA
jgi:hypothetical protein